MSSYLETKSTRYSVGTFLACKMRGERPEPRQFESFPQRCFQRQDSPQDYKGQYHQTDQQPCQEKPAERNGRQNKEQQSGSKRSQGARNGKQDRLPRMEANKAAASQPRHCQEHNRRQHPDVGEGAEYRILHSLGKDRVVRSDVVDRPPTAGAKSADFGHFRGAVGADHAGT